MACSLGKWINLGRGVRQGCPLATFLYALMTQPLMAILKQQAELGLLVGIPLAKDGNKQLLYQLYIDDTRMY